MAASRTSKKKQARKAGAPVLCARVNHEVQLEVYANGKVGVYIDGNAYELGNISPGTVTRAKGLIDGLPLASFSPARKPADRELEQLARRLARSGLLAYPLVSSRGNEPVALEPQTSDYWPHIARPANADRLVLSRFAYFRRRGNVLVLESP